MEVIKHRFLVCPDNARHWDTMATIARRMGWSAPEIYSEGDHIETISVPANDTDIALWNYLENRGVFDL